MTLCRFRSGCVGLQLYAAIFSVNLRPSKGQQKRPLKTIHATISIQNSLYELSNANATRARLQLADNSQKLCQIF